MVERARWHSTGTAPAGSPRDEAGSGASGDAEGEPHPHAAARVDWSKSNDSCWLLRFSVSEVLPTLRCFRLFVVRWFLLLCSRVMNLHKELKNLAYKELCAKNLKINPHVCLLGGGTTEEA